MATTLWIVAAVFALAAGITDLRWRRIPNWLTYPAAPVAIILHGIAAGKHAALISLAGLGLGLGILLPFVLLRMLGGGDWKLVGALGAFFGPHRLILVLFLTFLINAFMALLLVLWKKRLGQTARNIGQMLLSLFLFRSMSSELSIDSTESAKVPFGIAAAIAVLIYVSGQPWIAF
ncbi:MAG TPA: A24 family peptidase [Terriglobales bacterium]|nr:A24 family peptidase [Terriglobales bacterium]